MTAYIVADIVWNDPDKIGDYSTLAYPTLVAAGGKMLAATSQPEVIEGEWRPGIMVLIEFPSSEDAQNWLNSSDYLPARQVRQEYAKTNLVLIESIDVRG